LEKKTIIINVKRVPYIKYFSQIFNFLNVFLAFNKKRINMSRHLLTIISIFVISCSPIGKYKSLPEVKAWENDIQKFEQLDKSEAYSKDAILFTGSSSIRMWETLKKDMAPYPVIQRGFGGSKLSDFVVYADRIVSPHPCSAIVIFIANDITGSDKDKTPQEVAALFRSSLKIIRKSHPLTPVFWIGVTPTPSRWKVWPQIKEASALIKAICEKQKNTYYINTDFAFLDDKGLPIKKYFRQDMLHLNAEGYQLWNGIIKKELSKTVPVPAVEVIGHRGASYDAPENTIASANLAWKLGADAVECDIYLSKDNRIVISHDGNTGRTTGKKLEIKETLSDTLRKLDAGSFKDSKYKGEKIPFLEELIQTVPSGKELVVEVKCGSEVLDELQQTIAGYPKDRKLVFIGFDFKTISDTKKAFPGYPCYWLCSNPDLLQKNITLVKGAGLDGLSLSYNIITEAVVKQAADLGLELFSWTVDNPDEAKRLISLGVRGITTNRPGWLREQIYKN
jgi:glycerophosphoryl diester phosphodiesterase